MREPDGGTATVLFSGSDASITEVHRNKALEALAHHERLPQLSLSLAETRTLLGRRKNSHICG